MKGDIHELHKWSKKNTGVLDTWDWEVAFIGGAAGGTSLGAGGLFFGFRSLSLEQFLKFCFVSAGVAAGLAGSWNDPQDQEFDCSRADWRPLRSAMKEPFSATNLCDAKGRIGILSAATPGHKYLPIGWGYTKMILTGLYDGPKRAGYLFDKYDYSGTGFGTDGLAAGVFWGKWVFLGVPEPTRLNFNWKKPVCE